MMVSYGPLRAEEEEDEEDNIELSELPTIVGKVEDDFCDEQEDGQGELRLPTNLQDQKTVHNMVLWEEPWLLSVGITSALVIPTLLFAICLAFSLTWRMWSCLLFAVHLQVAVGVASLHVTSAPRGEDADSNNGERNCYCDDRKAYVRTLTSLAAILDLAMFGALYPRFLAVVSSNFFTDDDDTVVVEWLGYVRAFRIMRDTGLAVFVLRFTVSVITISVRCTKYFLPSHYAQWSPTYWNFPFLCLDEDGYDVNRREIIFKVCLQGDFRGRIERFLRVFSFGSFLLLLWCILAAISHFGPWPQSSSRHADCDPLDNTECILPFPSFHHMEPDSTTATGWRVNVRGHLLPPMRGNLPYSMGFLNGLDGFSTMAPLLFYMEGLKEAHEDGDNIVELRGPEEIKLSVTSSSATLLLDVASQELVYHSAEIDYLDPIRPMVMVFPAKPLKHNTHYALAVVNAADRLGHRLPPTDGMVALWKETNSPRRKRYREVVIPALEAAASFFTFSNDREALQLLFDFQTISEQSQLGNVRGVRDATMSHLGGVSWDWKEHVHTIAVQDDNCDADNATLIARTVHAELDVPWFLKIFGPGGRAAILNPEAIRSHEPVTIGRAKFMVQIPCSLREAALGGVGKNLTSVMEYGHGVFSSRMEVKETFLSSMANEHGYILTAMDWRGMSCFDLPVIIKLLIASPNLFESTRDNLIQGYANKLALQHFTANHLLSMDWLRFERKEIPRYDDKKPPTSVFYGISQGGILGAGYTTLAGPTGLIDRGILNAPGTPFALVMTRSIDFGTYDKLLLLGFYNNRQVRIIVTLVQMGWDSVEASGLLAPPVKESPPRLLLQAGLGDAEVPTSAAESLARALGASVLPNSPHHLFGIPTAPAANETWRGPDMTLTELLYERQYNELPLTDIRPSDNPVHYCVRLDAQLQHQVTEFVNTGRIINPCEEDECRRDSVCE